MLRRRGFIGGLASRLAAPAIIRTPGLLMPVRVVPPEVNWTSYPPPSNWAEIVNTTFRNRNPELYKSLMQHNILLGHFQGYPVFADRIM